MSNLGNEGGMFGSIVNKTRIPDKISGGYGLAECAGMRKS
jgi:hypothetical protein